MSQPADSLARQDASPLYLQLKNNLTEAIRSGRYAPGEPVPTETQLCEQYAVSRITVRRAISELQEEGLLEKRHGKGTFVSFRRMETSLVDLAGFSETYSLQGYKVSKVLLGVAEGAADGALAQKLAIQRGAPILTIRRLIMAADAPMTIEISDFPLALFPDLATEIVGASSIYRLLKTRYGREVRHARRVINVRLAGAEERERLNCRSGEPLFEVEKTVFDAAGTPLQRSLLLTPSNRVNLVIQV
ncbi:putative Uncharacterized HTH-type transcriptional regulator YurK [uncultured Pleomorphomonas sp.]|uniref:Putative Uncharacterized HTH-type transcriptional regulator YurK n=1 Tax=uncultured Pleomorphomonas sp. TaxID=442121 RepID=A0A212LJE2_9HYPH|nr:UTRA domain-containing protein [uncultured Pleomorphomonas sp.]SCM77664.1 putative Uncharacterized HTH-type transcriptional regulator YurK [uncultured Pleomorphomonas sp.]